jgi:pyruvate formate lyase activating enzyme
MGDQIQGTIFDIKKFALHDGPGIRTTVFFKGCPLSCWWCHNPESQNMNPENLLKSEENLETETVGRLVTVDEVMKEIMKDWIFYEESGEGGATFSGGEPLIQPRFLKSLLQSCVNNDIKTTVDTSGYTSWETIKDIKDLVDLFLYDIKLISDVNHFKYTGVSNKLILSNFLKLDEEGINTVIRFPIIPNITDTQDNIDQLLTLLDSLRTVDEIHLLPYHKIGNVKYKKLSRSYHLETLETPIKASITHLKELMVELGLKVKIGG